MLTLLVAPMAVPLVAVPVGVARRLVGGRAANRGRRSGAPALAATPKWSSTCIKDRVLQLRTTTIFVRFDVAYGAPAPREGVQPEEGGTLLGWGYIRMLP